VLVNEAGVQTLRTAPVAAPLMKGLWSPQWVWASGDAAAGADFRAELVVAACSKVKRAPARVSVDGRTAGTAKGTQDAPLVLAADAHTVTVHQ
jgi:hypothetical protein